MTLAPAPVKRGRPSAADDRRLDEIALHAEDLEFAERVRIGADRIVAAASTGSRLAVVNEAGKLGYLADRRIRQLGSVTL